MSGRGRENLVIWTVTELSPNSGRQSSENPVFANGRFCADFRPLPAGCWQPERRTHAYALPNASLPCPAFRSGPKTYAAWPVWSGSTTKEIRFQPMPKKAATQLWHRARDFDRQTKRKDHHGGAVGHAALQVLHTLIFDFLNYRSGRLDPSYAAIARKANVCERTVATALKRLRELGILNWVRRCAESWRDGRFVLEQETNAYAVLPDSAVARLQAAAGAARAHAGHLGRPPSPALAAGAGRRRAAQDGGDMRRMIQILDSDPGDALAAALARLGRAMQAAKSSVIYRTARHAEKHSLNVISLNRMT